MTLLIVNGAVFRLMYTVALAELKDGMILGDNITIGEKVVIKKGAKVDSIIRKQLAAYKLIAVNILEEEDFAETYYGKVKVSRVFKKFEEDYTANLMAYKVAVDSFIYKKVPFRIQDLLEIVKNLVHEKMHGRELFAYLYLHLPSEDQLPYAHGLNVALISKIFARWLGLNEKETEDLCISGFLFDLGKYMIPPDILYKPTKLNRMEYDLVKTHAFHGYYLLDHYSKNVNSHVLNATLQHHEYTDGSGYPQGLRGSEIDPCAKIMTILDTYEAMTSARSYRAAKCPYEVIHILEHNMLQHYDVHFTQLFARNIVDELIGSRVMLNDGTTWEVMMNNGNDLSRPILRNDNDVLDLSKNRDLSITGIL
ncbi:MAG: HD-GYP domain-containing protein [Lachnospiraceae bacterium]|nr:HD-GYP domain-containing protein [Lachnospiraceae bacterium]